MQKNKLNLRICGVHLLNPYKTEVSHLKLRGHAGDVHDTAKTTKPSLVKTNCEQGMRNIFHVLIIIAFFDLVYVYLITAVALAAKVVIFFFF